MATIRKRDNKWRAEVRRAGVYKSKSFTHKETARRWAQGVEADLELGVQPDSDLTLSQTIDRYLREVTPTKKGHRWDSIRLAMFQRAPMAQLKLSRLGSSDIVAWRDDRLKQVSGSSVTREMNLLSSLLTTCANEWELIRENPMKKVRRPGNSKPRSRTFSDDEIQRIADFCFFENKPVTDRRQELAVLFLFAIETGMRMGEILALTKNDIFADHVVVRDSKNNDTRDVPLSKRATELLTLVPERFVLSVEYASRLFRQTLQAADIKEATFHDSRHTAATRIASKLPLLDLCKMFGWRDPRHAMIYYNPKVSDLAKML